MSGDIFDSPNPSNEALELFFDFFHQLNCNAYLLAGNHDSGRFLEAPKAFFHKQNLFVHGIINETAPSYQLGPNLELVMLPFFRTSDLQKLASEGTVEEKICNYLGQRRTQHRILMAHHNFGNFFYSGSELTLALSGVQSLDPRPFLKEFDYMALGHLHSFQDVGDQKAIYCGAPLPFRFGENQQKFVSLISVGETLSWEKYPVPQIRPLFRISTTKDLFPKALEDCLKANPPQKMDAYLEVEIQLERPEAGLVDEIRNAVGPFPVELISFRTTFDRPDNQIQPMDPALYQNPVALFDRYYAHLYPNEEIDQEMRNLFIQITNELRNT